MKHLLIAAAAIALLAPAGAAFAQPGHHDDHRGGPAMMMRGPASHSWRKGDRFDHASWNRYQRVDYRRYHLSAPPRGYEWRRVDNNYVLAAAATGLVASVIAASR